MSEQKLPIPTASPLDYHARTANTDVEFQAFMDSTHPGWREMHERDIRDFAKRWNWGRLYGVGGSLASAVGHNAKVEVHIDGDGLVDRIVKAMPKLTRVEHTQVGDVSSTVLSGTEGAPGTIDPPPTPKTPVRGVEAPRVWPKVSMDVRRWGNAEFTVHFAAHGEVATMVMPIEVLRVFTDVYLREYRMVEENFLDGESVPDEIAKTVGVRPAAAQLCLSISQHIRHAFKG